MANESKIQQVQAFKVGHQLFENIDDAQEAASRNVIQEVFDDIHGEGEGPLIQYSEFEHALKSNSDFREAVSRLCLDINTQLNPSRKKGRR